MLVESWSMHNVGITLTGNHPPSPWAFVSKRVPSPRAFAQQKMPMGRAFKLQYPLGRAFASMLSNTKIVNTVTSA